MTILIFRACTCVKKIRCMEYWGSREVHRTPGQDTEIVRSTVCSRKGFQPILF